MADWHDNVPSIHGILWTAKRETDKGTGYVVHRFRYGAELHRKALNDLAAKGFLKRPYAQNPFLVFRITNAGRRELNRLEVVNKKGVFS